MTKKELEQQYASLKAQYGQLIMQNQNLQSQMVQLKADAYDQMVDMQQKINNSSNQYTGAFITIANELGLDTSGVVNVEDIIAKIHEFKK